MTKQDQDLARRIVHEIDDFYYAIRNEIEKDMIDEVKVNTHIDGMCIDLISLKKLINENKGEM